MRHQALNDLIAPRFSAADVLVTKEPSELLGKRPGGLSLVPWQSGKALSWDVTVICSLADSYISDAAREPGSVAKLAAFRKEAKYVVLGRRLSEKSGVSHETSFLFLRCSVLLQRFNAVSLHDSMPACDRMEF